MPKPRKEQVSLEATPYYHGVSRCVRKAFLCGLDVNTNESYEHRRAWLENELLNQAKGNHPDTHDKKILLDQASRSFHKYSCSYSGCLNKF